MKVCRIPGCPTLIPTDAYRGLCPEHRKQHDRDRGSSTTRGYGHQHQRTRAGIAAAITRGETIPCWRCNQPIVTTDDLHLGHDDHDRSITRGPEHADCNLTAAGKHRHTPRG